MSNPMVQSMLSNPDFIQTMIQSDPRFEQMVEQHPEIRQSLTDPNFLREISAAMRNPRLVKVIDVDARNDAWSRSRLVKH